MIHGALQIFICTSILASGCSSNGSDNGPTGPSSVTIGAQVTSPGSVTINSPTFPEPTVTQIQGMYAQFANEVRVTIDGPGVTLHSNGIPDHPSPYFGTGHSRYEAPHDGMSINPNIIVEQNLVIQVPTAPDYATPGDTPMGPIGLAVNGVVLFNQYAAMRQPLTFEIESFDRYNGHPAPGGEYHYHLEPLWLTASSQSRLIGVLLDGFPVYGPEDSHGQVPSDLDVCHGHVSATMDFPSGIYHYHVGETPPYIAGCFRGTPGTVLGARRGL